MTYFFNTIGQKKPSKNKILQYLRPSWIDTKLAFYVLNMRLICLPATLFVPTGRRGTGVVADDQPFSLIRLVNHNDIKCAGGLRKHDSPLLMRQFDFTHNRVYQTLGEA